MFTSWPMFRSFCKTPLSSLARSLFLARQRLRLRLQRKETELEETRRELVEARSAQRKLEVENEKRGEQIADLQQQLTQQAKEMRIQLPPDPPQAGQQFGPRIIELCINLARQIGMRPTVRVLKIVFSWLKLKPRLPSKDTIRGWLQRLGVARMKKTGKLKDAVWLVDETVQIGKEKVLAVLAVEREQFQNKGKPLAHKDMQVLAFRPATSWTGEDVAKVYSELSKVHGSPRAVITDGGRNLRDPIGTIKTRGRTPLALRDLKHFLANALEAEVGRSDAFQEYTKKIHLTISSVQQTELAHFAPPSFNRRSRFMNLQKHTKWFSMILWQLDHPDSSARKTILPERMQEKLGWAAGFKSAVKSWIACQSVISGCLKFSNSNGIYRGAAKDMRAEVGHLATCSSSKAILTKAVTYFRECEKSIRKNEQLPISTEILESSFGSFKRLERHHSRGGFTTLIPAFATLLRPTTAKEISNAFKKVKVKDVRSWLASNILSTVTSRKQEAFRESRSKKHLTLCSATG